MRDGESADARGRRSAPPLPRAQSADRRAGQARQSRQGTVVFPRHLRLRAVAPRSAPTARRADDGRRPSLASASQDPDPKYVTAGVVIDGAVMKDASRYALTEAMDEGHCGLPTDQLIPLAEEL